MCDVIQMRDVTHKTCDMTHWYMLDLWAWAAGMQDTQRRSEFIGMQTVGMPCGIITSYTW